MPILITMLLDKLGAIAGAIAGAVATVIGAMLPYVWKGLMFIIKMTTLIWGVNLLFSIFPYDILRLTMYHLNVMIYLALGWGLHPAVLSAIMGLIMLKLGLMTWAVVLKLFGVISTNIGTISSGVSKDKAIASAKVQKVAKTVTDKNASGK